MEEFIAHDKPHLSISWMHQSKTQLELIKICYLKQPKLAYLFKQDRFGLLH